MFECHSDADNRVPRQPDDSPSWSRICCISCIDLPRPIAAVEAPALVVRLDFELAQHSLPQSQFHRRLWLIRQIMNGNFRLLLLRAMAFDAMLLEERSQL